MKTLLIWLAIMLQCLPCYAGGVLMMGGGVAATGVTCSSTIGENVAGSSANPAAAGFTWVQRQTLGCGAASSAATFNFKLRQTYDTSHQVVLLIYADNAGEPGALIWQSDPLYNAAWLSTAVTITDIVDTAITQADYIWIGFTMQSTGSSYHFTSNSPTRTTRTITNGGTFPDVDSNWDTANDAISAYGMVAYLTF